MSNGFPTIADRLEACFAGVGVEPLTDGDFSDLALACFEHQYAACAPYRALCDARGVTPDAVTRWEEVPMVPATGFKHFDFDSAGGRPEAVFRTSGTTRGAAARGRHAVPRLSLYRAAALPPLRQALLPDVPHIAIASLIPPPNEAPESSLSVMVGMAVEAFASESWWLVDGQGRWRGEGLDGLRATCDGDAPILLFGTALALQHAVERSMQGKPTLPRLPAGSRVMETGGFKGASRRVSRQELYEGIGELTGVPAGRIVNEYGMTELLSQLWEPVLTEGPGAAGVHVPAPWLRVRALDPSSLEPLPEGADGVLAFLDLANLGSVCHVLTEDVGAVVGGRVRLRGRTPGSEPRGCSRAMDELMSAAG
jgi:hypothetical protein